MYLSENALLEPNSVASGGKRYWVCVARSAIVETILDKVLLAFHSALLASCALFAVLNRKCWSTVSESVSLSFSIYFTVLLAIIDKVLQSLRISPLALLYTRSLFLCFGCGIILFVQFFSKVLPVLRNKNDRSTISITKSGNKTVEDMFEDVVEIRTSFSERWSRKLFSTGKMGSKWEKVTLVLVNGRHMFFVNHTYLPHYLVDIALIEKHDTVPFSFQLVGKSYAYWIKCKNEESFLTLFSLLSVHCNVQDVLD
jgi:hypothetical protein